MRSEGTLTLTGFAAVVFFSFALTACESGQNAEAVTETNTFSVESPEFATYFHQRAQEFGLQIEPLDRTKFRFVRSEAEQVERALRTAAAEFLPDNRSAHYPEKLQTAIEQRLATEGIAYRKIIHNGEEWLVWEESEMEQVREIQEQVEAEYFFDHCCEG